MPHIIPTSANETIDEEIGDYYPVFHDAFHDSPLSQETLQKPLRLAFPSAVPQNTSVLFCLSYGNAACD